MARDWTLIGSTDNFVSSNVSLDSRSSQTSWAAAENRNFTISSPGAYRYYKLRTTAQNGSGQVIVGKLQLNAAGTTNNMTLVTTMQTSDSTVSNGRILLEYDNTATPALNTDLTGEVTCNGGTNWASASFSAVTAYSQAGRKVVESVDQSCGANTGTSFGARIKTLNNKNVPIYGATVTAH